jgi:C4-dicarboxylate-specific signal transduction histidine kinase
MPDAPSCGGDILIIDDQPANLRVLTTLLCANGYRVRPAISGQLALKAARKAPPDLILLDVMMSSMDGYSVCEQLKADERTRGIPIIFVSALGDTENKVRALALGAVDYITKPFQAEEVLARVRTHLALRAAHQQLAAANARLQEEIGERQRAEQALRQSHQRLEDALRELQMAQTRIVQTEKLSALGRLAAGIAHEINNPLTGALCYVDYACQKATEPTVKEVLGKADQALQRLGKTVRNMLAFARQTPETALRPVDLRQVVNDALQLLSVDLRHRQITVDVDLPESLPRVFGSHDGLQQVFVNLLMNARDAIADNEIREIRVRAAVREAGIEIAVSDSGPGISARIREQIFDPFFTTKPVGTGTGLGLSISRSIVAGCGGTLVCDSIAGHGATFRVTLPLPSTERPAAAGARPAAG